jgi:hypothetical protein
MSNNANNNCACGAPKESTQVQCPSCKEKTLLAVALEAIQNPNVRSKLVGLSELKNNRPYYNEKAAQDLIPLVNDMMKDKIELEFPVEVFKENNDWSRNTLFMFVQQTLDWIGNHYDPDKDGRYSEFRKSVKITNRANEVSIWIRWHDHVKFGQRTGGMLADVKKHTLDAPNVAWREELMNWMQNPDGPKAIKMDKLNLTDEDKAWIRQTLMESEGTFELLRLESHELKIGRAA